MVKYPNLIEKNVDIVEKNIITPNELYTKDVLITGASGLLGVNFLEFFTRRCKNVFITVRPESKSPDYLLPLCKKNICKFLTDFSSYSKPIDGKFDYIIHTAGYSSPSRFMQEEIETIRIGCEATDKLISRNLKKGGKFLYISTSELYSDLEHNGEGYHESQVANVPLDHKRIAYIEAKRMGEVIVNVARKKGIDAKSVRVSLVYGPGIKYGDTRVLHDLIFKALKNNEIRLLDDGSSVRTYCYIPDGIEMMMNSLFYGQHSLYNIGGKSFTSIYDMALLISKHLGDIPVITNGVPGNMGAPTYVKLNLNRYLQDFGKQNFIPFELGVKETIEWQKYVKGCVEYEPESTRH